MIYFIGDVHELFKGLAHQLDVLKIRDSTFVQVGDFGVGLGNKRDEQLNLKTLNKALIAGNNILYVIRGNHDDPNYFEALQKIGNIRLMPDYSILELEGQSLLLIGGAISIDRMTLAQGKNYWKTEKFIYDESKLVKCLAHTARVDIVVTHSAPSEFCPHKVTKLVESYARIDLHLLDELASEREMHSKLLNYVSNKFIPKHWYYGHFHTTYDDEHEGLKYHALGELEIREHAY